MNLTNFVDHRISLRSPDDGTTYHGWIEETSQTMIVIQGTSVGPPTGSQLECKVAYRQATAMFAAVCTHSLGNDFAVRVVGELTVQALHEDPRFRIDLEADLFQGDSMKTVRVSDVSLSGVGIVSNESLASGAKVAMLFHDFGEIRVTGTVRHSTPREDGFGFRTGIELDAMGRVERSRWRRLLQHGDPVLLSVRIEPEQDAA